MDPPARRWFAGAGVTFEDASKHRIYQRGAVAPPVMGDGDAGMTAGVGEANVARVPRWGAALRALQHEGVTTDHLPRDFPPCPRCKSLQKSGYTVIGHCRSNMRLFTCNNNKST